MRIRDIGLSYVLISVITSLSSFLFIDGLLNFLNDLGIWVVPTDATVSVTVLIYSTSVDYSGSCQRGSLMNRLGLLNRLEEKYLLLALKSPSQVDI